VRCSMRGLVFSLVLSAGVVPAFAAKRITVAQLEQMLTTDRASHKSDLDTAKRVSAVELSERLTEDALSRLRQPFASDSRTATALLLLADRSAFLDPPASELPPTAPPDEAGQQHLLEMAHEFALQTLPRLPNLLATRTTFSFDDSPQELTKGAYAQRAGMHLLGSTKAEVSVSNERSGHVSAAKGAAGGSGGLSTWGEFGSALLIILSDATQGKTTWSHWEKTPAGMMAVFHYAVPKNASHYEIDTSVQEMQAEQSSRWAGARASDVGRVTMSSRMIRSKPAYEGSLWIDAASGIITRLTLVANLKGNPKFERGAILVEYGPVQIAGKTLICPLRSLALSEAPATVNSTFSGTATEWLNENIFNNYHLFSSTTRILTDEATATSPTNAVDSGNPTAPAGAPSAAKKDAPENVQDPAAPGHPSTPQVEASTASPSTPTTPPAPSEKSETAGLTNITASSLHDAANAPIPPPSGHPEPQPNVATASPLPLDIARSASVPEDTPKLRIETQEVLVPVVVRDKQGHALGNLTKDDFTVLDQGKAKEIRGFSVIEPASARGARQSAGAAPQPTGPDATGSNPAASNRFIIFLFDDRHVSNSDLAIAQKAATRMMDEPLASTDYPAVLSLSGANSGITQDRAVLKSAVMKLSVHHASEHWQEDCPDVDYYSADKIIHQHDPIEFQLAVLKAKKCSNLKIFQPSSSQSVSGDVTDPGDPFQRMAMAAATRELLQGEEDAHQTLVQIGAVVRAMSKLPGQRILILLSPGFLSLAPDAIAFKSEILNEAAGANVVINALDVRGLYVGNLDASQGENASLSQTFGATASDHLAGMQASENAMAELSNGTGGTFFHNSNDLLGGLKSLAAEPEYVYLLGISLNDVKANGTFHQLKVKVNKHDVDVQARRGYFAPKH
jgi:VWFA-related protein